MEPNRRRERPSKWLWQLLADERIVDAVLLLIALGVIAGLSSARG